MTSLGHVNFMPTSLTLQVDLGPNSFHQAKTVTLLPILPGVVLLTRCTG